MLNVVSTSTWYTLLPLIVLAAVMIGVLFLIVIGVLIGRRVTISVRMSGAVALTLASMLLLSGVWCMLLSPTVTHIETKESFYTEILIDGSGSWSYSLSVQEGDSLTGSLDGFRGYNDPPNASGKAFNAFIYNPDGNLVWSETDVTYAHFNVKALKTGVYRVEVQNPNQNEIGCNVHISATVEVTYRPLDPIGQWLSLISLPMFGLGIWASGLLTGKQRETH